MITQFFFTIIITVFDSITSFLPQVSSLPFGIDGVLQTSIGWVNSLVVLFWPIEVILSVFLWYLTFRVGLVLLKLIMGTRTPHTH